MTLGPEDAKLSAVRMGDAIKNYAKMFTPAGQERFFEDLVLHLGAARDSVAEELRRAG